jgi:hypothetical protein
MKANDCRLMTVSPFRATIQNMDTHTDKFLNFMFKPAKGHITDSKFEIAQSLDTIGQFIFATFIRDIVMIDLLQHR